MKKMEIFTFYLLPMLLQITVIALIAAVLRNREVLLGYESVTGIVLIVLSGVSSALWGILYQCRYNQKNFLEIVKDFFDIRQSGMAYLLVILFLLIDFGGAIIGKGFRMESMWVPVSLFLKALVFGGIEEIGWRYTFQPVMERIVTYIPAVFITFVCWGIWHFLFFYIDGSLAGANIPFFLLGLLTNCFILSALYAYSGSLWICAMTHALINALSQIAVDDVDGNVIVGIVLKIACMVLAVILYYTVSMRRT